MIISSTQIRQYAYNAGFRDAALDAAVKIALCESSGDTSAHNTNGEDSRGLFQINVDFWTRYLFLNLYDPQVNANTAYEIYLMANKTFRDWTCAHNLGLVNPEKKSFEGILLASIGVIALYSISRNK